MPHFLPGFRCILLPLLLCFGGAGLSLAAPVPSKPLGYQVAKSALLWMPDALSGVLSRRLAGLEQGAMAVPKKELLADAGRLRLETEIFERASACLQRLRSQPSFREVSEDFGALAEMILLMNLPGPEDLSPELTGKLEAAIERNTAAFRLVVYDSSATETGPGRVQQLVTEIKERRTKLSGRFRLPAVRQALIEPSGTLDPKSPLYGLASLIYSHSVNDVATIWLWIWQAANGDMSGGLLGQRTLGGPTLRPD